MSNRCARARSSPLRPSPTSCMSKPARVRCRRSRSRIAGSSSTTSTVSRVGPLTMSPRFRDAHPAGGRALLVYCELVDDIPLNVSFCMPAPVAAI
jgi:hypothetical protein